MTKINTLTLTPPTACKKNVTYKVSPHTLNVTFNFTEVAPSTSRCTKCPHSTACALANPITKIALNPPPKPAKLQPQAKIDTTDFPTVPVSAFTGMNIGSLPVIEDTNKTLTVITGKQIHLVFDKATGVQVNAVNPNFANHIDPQPATLPLSAASTQPSMT